MQEDIVDVDAPFWDQPDSLNDTTLQLGMVDDIHWRATFGAARTNVGDIGWARVLGIQLGLHGRHNFLEDIKKSETFRTWADAGGAFADAAKFPDVLPSMDRILGGIRSSLRDIEVTRRVVQTLKSATYGDVTGYLEEIKSDAVKFQEIAANIEALFAAHGRRDHTKFTASLFGVSERTVAYRLAEARKRRGKR